MGDKLLEKIKSSAEVYNLTGSVGNDLKLKVMREALGRKIVCKVANKEMEIYLTAFVQIDLNIRPVSTVISGEKEVVDEGDDIHLVCSSGGARPAAVITWYNGSLSNPLILPPARHISSLQEDGTYATISQLVITADRHHNNNMLYCQATNEVTQNHIQDQERAKYQLRVRYRPAVQVMERWIAVNQSDQVSVSCAYQANPHQLLGVEWFHNKIWLT